MKRLSVITQFKIEFLLPFTRCRKMFGKMVAALLLSFPAARHTPLILWYLTKIENCLCDKDGVISQAAFVIFRQMPLAELSMLFLISG